MTTGAASSALEADEGVTATVAPLTKEKDVNAMPTEPVNREEVFAYLDVLRSTGITNVFGAADYVADGFDISPGQARTLLADWVKSKENGI